MLKPPPANPIPPAARPKRATSAEMQQRVVYTIQMILDGRRDHEIKRFFRDQYGVGSRQTQTYLLLARRKLAPDSQVDVEQMGAEFWTRYMRIFREAATDAAKINALRAAGALYGLEAPQKVAQTTADGRDVRVIRAAVKELSVDELRALRRVRDRMAAIAQGDEGGGD